MDGEQRLLVQGVDGVLLEDFLQEHLAQRGGQLIDQPADAQVLVVDDVLLRIEDLAHLDGDLGLLIALGQVPQVGGHRADAHHHRGLTAGAQCLLDGGGDLVQVLDAGPLRHLPDQDHIPLTDAEDKVVLPVREQGLDHVRGNGLSLLQGADHEHAPGHVRHHPQLLGPHIDVPQHDVVGDDVLDKGPPVMFFLIIGLGRVQRHSGHGADRPADLVVPEGKGCIVKLRAPTVQRLEGLAVRCHDGAAGGIDDRNMLRPPLADHRQFAAGDHDALAVNDTHRPVRIFLELQHHILKNSSRHGRSPPQISHVGALCKLSMAILYRQI